MLDEASELSKAYRKAGQAVLVLEISPGRFEVVKPRSKQIITLRELHDEIERLRKP